MATHYSANQYDSGFNPQQLQNWTVPKLYKQRPSTHEGFTQFIANDRGHLLSGVPRAKTSPWGTFLGTWDMPLKIPPSKLSLTSRSADASKRLTQWVENSDPLISASNGLRPTITGKVPMEKEGSRKPSPTPNQRNGSVTGSPEKTGEMAAQRSPAVSPTGSHKDGLQSCQAPEEVEQVHSGRRPPSQYDAQKEDRHLSTTTPICN
ncbi:LOW QUALITY PROTEIN: protein Flattop [Aquarana catesbeiana]|uniref:LOW QUALITY PROTEIN: protein Flattop n=1 Tax=Aquarana catesbeiana TaxID=8400 RepID=UPI003CC96068